MRVSLNSQPKFDVFFFSPDAGYPSHAPDADAPHAPWYRHAPGYEHDARRTPSTGHPHGHGAPGSASSRHVAGRSAEDGSAQSGHGVTAGGESQAAGGVYGPCNLMLSFFLFSLP